MVLEAGCGIGAQTVTLAQRSPDARFTSFDVSADSVAQAKRTTDAAGITNVHFQQADIFALPFAPESFDHIFVCFVLEHLSRPAEALTILNRLLRPGGTMTVIEGDHGSTYFHPDSSAARMAIQCLVELQRLAGGNALIGRQLYPLMVEAGLDLRLRPISPIPKPLMQVFEIFTERPRQTASSATRSSRAWEKSTSLDKISH